MKTIKAKKIVNIWGEKNAWSHAPHPGTNQRCSQSLTELEIQGDDQSGYHLVMSPVGYFSADYWYESLQEAKESAEKFFGVTDKEWL
ncbi:hypothetical protein ACNKU7_16915 [Microbulbifer sp. SA54]|uniref:hypothetical protein n=1 Tax=Microbulbifer sp. SA54 TaxID=3401577 RepID=UPI003AAD8428